MNIADIFNLNISEDQLSVTIELKDGVFIDQSLMDQVDQTSFNKFLDEHKISYGLNDDVINKILSNIEEISFPVEIAKGKEPVNGVDGYIEFKVDTIVKMKIDENETINFKEVMKIPKVETGDTLAVYIPPTDGEDGINVLNQSIKHKPGKVPAFRAGENTKYVENECTYYATDHGQVSVTEKHIKVLPVYEVPDTIDLNTGNIDFNGSIVVRGDVPEGFSLKAKGDISIFGLVEAATLEAGGSVFIKEGISGLGQGRINAGLDIHIKNVNQGNLSAGRSIVVDQSIFHSDVIARETIHCQRGHIIGGSVSAGKKVTCKDVGNRMNTKTFIYLGENKNVRNKRLQIEQEMEQLKETIEKLKKLGNQLLLIYKSKGLSEKEKSTLVKQKSSLDDALLNLKDLEMEHQAFAPEEYSSDFIKLSANGIIYPNTEMIVGKYSKRFTREEKYISVVFKENDFTISSL
ncbi:DUF342 domain-containing protein [Filobacillus milosensis]|uniref:DUF342 domain-containing protein n=1 Tax=Filobacillus milosensis TaxID=94137 RepID=UPI00189104C9|nr:FapA family protein [Filobacillus milosensis]